MKDKSKLFSVIEYRSFFAVRHNPTGEERPMGDGVDQIFDSEGNSIDPGSPEFISTWEKYINDYPADIMEAYFSELI
jgi:hypothetical protein